MQCLQEYCYFTCWDLLWWINMKFSTWYYIVWCIKTTFLLNKLQDYCFLPDGTLCDASKRIFFWSIVCSDCKNAFFHMLGPSLRNQNEFGLEVTNAVIARIIFSACWNIVWCTKTYFLLKDCMQWLKEYCFIHVWDILWCIKTNFLLKYCMQWLKEYCFIHVWAFSDESIWI